MLGELRDAGKHTGDTHEDELVVVECLLLGVAAGDDGDDGDLVEHRLDLELVARVDLLELVVLVLDLVVCSDTWLCVCVCV